MRDVPYLFLIFFQSSDYYIKNVKSEIPNQNMLPLILLKTDNNWKIKLPSDDSIQFIKKKFDYLLIRLQS